MTGASAIAMEQLLETTVTHSRGLLLFLAPVAILVGAVLPYPKSRLALRVALALLVLQTAGLYLPVPPKMATVGGLGSECRLIFAGLLAIYICVLLLPEALRQSDRRMISTSLLFAFLVLYAAGAVFLINNAEPGRRQPVTNETPNAIWQDSPSELANR